MQWQAMNLEDQTLDVGVQRKSIWPFFRVKKIRATANDFELVLSVGFLGVLLLHLLFPHWQ